MLRSTKDLENFAISATDGQIGHVEDFYFDDDLWVLRYFVVETGSWWSGHKVLISPISVRHPEWLDQTLPVCITKEQVRGSPDIDTDMPVSRQNEEQYMGYYGYPYYWAGTGLWGAGLYPYELVPGYSSVDPDVIEREREIDACQRAQRARGRNDDSNLRSCKAVLGDHLHATDGEIGHVAGYLIDDKTWAIRYVIVDTSNWWMGHKVLVAPEWITGLHWLEKTVSVDITRESVEGAPAFDPEISWSRQLDLSLYKHHGRAGYWADSSLLEREI